MANAARVEHAAVPCLTLAPPIEVLLVDDQRAILAGITALIESADAGLRVAGHARNGGDALELARRIRPRVIVLDIDLGGENGLDLIPRFHACCDAAIIVLTCHAEPALGHRATRLGAMSFVSKTASGGELIAAIVDAAG